MDWTSPSNELRLNPRLPAPARTEFERAWRELVEPRFEGQVGIATSGSSGDSHGKLIVLSKTAFLANARAVNAHFGVTAKDIWHKTLPDFHVGGLSIYARASLTGSRVVNDETKWDPRAFCDSISRSKATLTALVPTQLYDLVRADVRAPESVRVTVIGGGRLEATLRGQALSLGWPIYVSYGFTECCSQVASARSPEDARLVPLAHAQVRIGAGDHIEVKSEALLTGQIVDGRFIDPKMGGWFRTEDRGSFDGDTLSILGRNVDFIKIGGEGVLMSRLEERFEALKVRAKFEGDAAILAAQDERLGARVVVIATAEVEKLVTEFNKGVLPFERIRSVHRVSEVPRSALGKILRKQALDLVGLKALAES